MDPEAGGTKASSRLTKKSINIVCWPHGHIRRKDTDSYLEQSKQIQDFANAVYIPILIITLIPLISILGMFGSRFLGTGFIIILLTGVIMLLSRYWREVSNSIALRLLPRSFTNLQLTQHHIEFWWTRGGVTAGSDFILWHEITNVYMKRSKGTSVLNDQLCFRVKTGKVFSVRLKQIASKEQWDNLLVALDTWCPISLGNLDRGAFDQLSPLDVNAPSFTRLWLQSLSKPPKPHRLEPLQTGTLLDGGRYTVQQQIGVGGQGRAYLAEKDNGASVVIKEYLLPIYVDIKARRQSLKNIEQEASMLSALDHPSIVKLIEFFCEDDRAYLVLEHIDGSSLKSLVHSTGSLEQCKVVEYAKNMCDILTYLHSRTPPVVHGDFTPDNLIVQSDGALKLIDFTIAQQADETITSIVAGKSAYMPPEQYRGIINVQSDIYALGATLYFLLTSDDPEPIASLHPILQREDITGDLDNIVAKCTALDPKERYNSAAQIKDDLAKLK